MSVTALVPLLPPNLLSFVRGGGDDIEPEADDEPDDPQGENQQTGTKKLPSTLDVVQVAATSATRVIATTMTKGRRDTRTSASEVFGLSAVSGRTSATPDHATPVRA